MLFADLGSRQDQRIPAGDGGFVDQATVGLLVDDAIGILDGIHLVAFHSQRLDLLDYVKHLVLLVVHVPRDLGK